METQNCWLIYHKASMGERSSMNMDGSTYGYGIAVVPEKDLKKALDRFEAELKSDFMELIEIHKCVHYGIEPFKYESELVDTLDRSVQIATSRDAVYILGIGNESFPDAEDA